jgi:hypothetical protein
MFVRRQVVRVEEPRHVAAGLLKAVFDVRQKHVGPPVPVHVWRLSEMFVLNREDAAGSIG